MTTLEVTRTHPPSIGVCRGCGAPIEWVRTHAGRFMPIDAPLLVERQHETHDGRALVVIDASRSHFVTCPEAARFSRRKR